MWMSFGGGIVPLAYLVALDTHVGPSAFSLCQLGAEEGSGWVSRPPLCVGTPLTIPPSLLTLT